jgi:hypothetical protein
MKRKTAEEKFRDEIDLIISSAKAHLKRVERFRNDSLRLKKRRTKKKNHGENKERSHRERKKARISKKKIRDNMTEQQKYHDEVKNFWNGTREDHP